MSFIARLQSIFGAKVNKTFDNTEDPRASLSITT